MEKIQVTQMKNYISDALKAKIFEGSIKDGQELTQEFIAETLEVSRMPVREAFQMLEQEGYLERLPNRRMRVNGIFKEGILCNIQILLGIEREIAVLIIQYNKDISTISDSLNEYKNVLQNNNIKSCVDAEINFHKQLSFTLGDKYIERLHHKMVEGYFAYTLRSLSYDMGLSMDNLENILNSIISKDIKKLYESLDDYYKNITKLIIGELENEKLTAD